MTQLFKKLNLSNQESILVLNAPESFESELLTLEGIKIARKVTSKTVTTFAIGFAVSRQECDQVAAQLIKASVGDAILWIAYPKGTSKKYKCDFNRDSGWTTLGDAGYEPVRMVAIDEDWSALRFRKAENIKNLKRSNSMAISAEGKKRTKLS
jgi:hypothetical protein